MFLKCIPLISSMHSNSNNTTVCTTTKTKKPHFWLVLQQQQRHVCNMQMFEFINHVFSWYSIDILGMDHIVQPFYHPTEYPVHKSLHQLLATKTFTHTSTTKWREQRMNSSLPIHKSKLSSLHQELITPSLSHSLHSYTEYTST